jgi:CheY-like chemotaxis protein
MMRVLVIDDEPDVLLLCKLNLEHAGHEVLGALEAAEGLALAREARPDVVVLDLMLPAMDGYQVLAALQEDAATRDLPVVILTAKAQMKDRMRCWEDGASDFVTKPFPPEQLLDSLDRVMAMTPDDRAELRESTLRELRREA